jgi:hypothetical protein
MPKITKAERIALHKQWEERISEFRMSGQTRRAWCEANHVSLRQFHYWFGKISSQGSKSRSQPGPWAQIQVKETVQVGRPSIQSALSVRVGPAVIEVRDGYNPSLLLNVVKVLQELC